jgi:hypothetical protein
MAETGDTAQDTMEDTVDDVVTLVDVVVTLEDVVGSTAVVDSTDVVDIVDDMAEDRSTITRTSPLWSMTPPPTPVSRVGEKGLISV